MKMVRRIGSLYAVICLSSCPVGAGQMTQAEQMQASALNQKHDWQALAALADRSARRDPNDGWAWYYYGVANDGLGNKSAAASAFEKSLPGLPPYMHGSAAQLLAQDYLALQQPAKIEALIGHFEKSDPDVSRNLRLQFPGSIPRTRPPLPEVSPRTLAGMTATARRSWKTDAIPVEIGVTWQDNVPYQVVYSFYSPSAHIGVQILQNGPRLAADHPVGWSSVAIPANFLPLAEAVLRVAQKGQNPLVQHALLLVEDSGIPAVALKWTIALEGGGFGAADLPAYVMQKPEFDALTATAERGGAQSQYVLAMVYLSGVAGPILPGKSVTWLIQSANRGNVEAENKLGQLYEDGVGVETNATLAARWYQKAANAGFAPAEYNLGLMFEYGRGVARNNEMARQWIEKAARRGSTVAMDELPIVTAAARGDIRRAEQLRAQQTGAKNRGGCRPGFFGGNGAPCHSFSMMVWAAQHPHN
jgi:tetratricopeptide (TPR) repeat protein